MKALTEEWVQKAENDFAAAEWVLNRPQGPINDVACFHAQQCAEKYLKAFLQEHSQPFPRTHSLLHLLNLCINIQPAFDSLRGTLENLESYSVAVRYPGAIVSHSIALQALQAASHMREFVRNALNLT